MQQLAMLTVPRSIANDLDRVLSATSEQFDVPYVYIHRDGDGQTVGVLMRPEEFERLRVAAGES